MKKYIMRIIAVIVILVIVLSPYLLIIDFERNAPFVVMVWIISIAYYLLVRKRVQQILDNDNLENEENLENKDSNE
jgi:hypothetical protein